MSIWLRLLRWIAGVLVGLGLFVGIALLWGGLLMYGWPWETAGPEGWPQRYLLLVRHASGATGALTYREYVEAVRKGEATALKPDAGKGELTLSKGDDHSASRHLLWISVPDKSWQIELEYAQRDYSYQVRYRLDADNKPILIESRVRGPQIGLLSIPLGLATMFAWKLAGRWRKSRTNEDEISASHPRED